MNDPIVDEVRQIRDAHAARFNYDLDAIFRDIKDHEKKSGLKFVQGVAHQPATVDTLNLIEDTGPVTPASNSRDDAVSVELSSKQEPRAGNSLILPASK